jgi:hypothetical protein
LYIGCRGRGSIGVEVRGWIDVGVANIYAERWEGRAVGKGCRKQRWREFVHACICGVWDIDSIEQSERGTGRAEPLHDPRGAETCGKYHDSGTEQKLYDMGVRP